MTYRMGNAAAAMLIGAFATVTFVGAMSGLAHAADNCLAGPKGVAPKGSHWYYRIDRATKRNCWYVRAATEKAVSPRVASVTEVPPPPAPTPLRPAVANARAEAAAADAGQWNATGALSDSPVIAKNDQGPDASAADNGQPTVASRWLDQTAGNAVNTSTPNPAASDPPASDPSLDAPAPTPAANPPAAHARAASSSGPVSTLFLVIVGALATAGLFGAVIVRFGGARRSEPEDFARDRHAPWDTTEAAAAIRSPPLATETPAPTAGPAREQQAAVVPDEIMRLLSTLSKEVPA